MVFDVERETRIRTLQEAPDVLERNLDSIEGLLGKTDRWDGHELDCQRHAFLQNLENAINEYERFVMNASTHQMATQYLPLVRQVSKVEWAQQRYTDMGAPHSTEDLGSLRALRERTQRLRKLARTKYKQCAGTPVETVRPDTVWRSTPYAGEYEFLRRFDIQDIYKKMHTDDKARFMTDAKEGLTRIWRAFIDGQERELQQRIDAMAMKHDEARRTANGLIVIGGDRAESALAYAHLMGIALQEARRYDPR